MSVSGSIASCTGLTPGAFIEGPGEVRLTASYCGLTPAAFRPMPSSNLSATEGRKIYRCNATGFDYNPPERRGPANDSPLPVAFLSIIASSLPTAQRRCFNHVSSYDQFNLGRAR